MPYGGTLPAAGCSPCPTLLGCIEVDSEIAALIRATAAARDDADVPWIGGGLESGGFVGLESAVYDLSVSSRGCMSLVYQLLRLYGARKNSARTGTSESCFLFWRNIQLEKSEAVPVLE